MVRILLAVKIAYEPALNICLMMHLSRERTILVCYRFLQAATIQVWQQAYFYRWCAMVQRCLYKWLRLQDRVYGTECKNLMERFIQHIKYRTECFDDHFPCRKSDCDRQHVWNWLLKLFVLYLHAGTDRMRFMMFLSMDGS